MVHPQPGSTDSIFSVDKPVFLTTNDRTRVFPFRCLPKFIRLSGTANLGAVGEPTAEVGVRSADTSAALAVAALSSAMVVGVCEDAAAPTSVLAFELADGAGFCLAALSGESVFRGAREHPATSPAATRINVRHRLERFVIARII